MSLFSIFRFYRKFSILHLAFWVVSFWECESIFHTSCIHSTKRVFSFYYLCRVSDRKKRQHFCLAVRKITPSMFCFFLFVCVYVCVPVPVCRLFVYMKEKERKKKRSLIKFGLCFFSKYTHWHLRVKIMNRLGKCSRLCLPCVPIPRFIFHIHSFVLFACADIKMKKSLKWFMQSH